MKQAIKEYKVLSNDIIFKNVFNAEDELKRLLKETLNLNVLSAELAPTEMEVESIKERRKILDLIVVTDEGIINVEVNFGYKEEIDKRNFLYFCKLISSSLKTSKDYTKVQKHIQLNLTWNLQRYFQFDVKNKRHICLYMMDEETKEKVYDDIFKIVHINMDYFRKIWYDNDEEQIKKENPFLMFLASRNIEEMEKISKGDKQMEKMVNKVKKLNWDPEVLKELVIEDEQEIWANTFRSAGEAKGRAEGEAKRNLEIARNMLSKGLKISLISEVTGLTKKEIEDLA